MRLSICIVNWNTSRLLAECLRSIYREAPDFQFETIVVDNASDDFDEAALLQEFPSAILIRNKRNEGYARGNNQAIERSSGEYVLLLNPDTSLHSGALAALVCFMDQHAEAGAAGCKLVRPDGTVDPSCRGFPTPLAVAFEYVGLSKLFPGSRLFGRYRMTWFRYDEVAEVDQPMASCLILRRQALDQVGLFDERFPIFFNDVDWCYRAKQSGWRIYFTPDAVATHHGGASTKQRAAEMIRESHRSLALYYDKRYPGLAGLPARAMVKLGVWMNLRLLHRRGKELRD